MDNGREEKSVKALIMHEWKSILSTVHKEKCYAERAINNKILVLYNAFKDHKEIRAKVLLQKLIEMYRKAEDYKNFPYSKVKQRSNSELGI